jgi:hypothetical protein
VNYGRVMVDCFVIDTHYVGPFEIQKFQRNHTGASWESVHFQRKTQEIGKKPHISKGPTN